MYETVVHALLDGGWPARDAVAVMRTVEAHVLGSALDIVAPDDLLVQATVPADLAALRSALDPEHADAYGADRAFRLGLAALMLGLRQRHAATAEPSAAPGRAATAADPHAAS